jgi:uncharacterized membrane-anchored protein YitT (DUF2179 family)
MSTRFSLLKIIDRKRFWKDYFFLTLGSIIVAAGYVFFITPYRIIPGGVYGISIIIHYLTQGFFTSFRDGLPIGATALLFNIPLFIAAYKILGSTYGIKTVVTFVLTAVFTDLFSFFYNTGIGVNNQLVPDEPLLASIYGGALIGVGVAFIFKARATSAGTDVLARIIARTRNQQIGTLIIIVDSIIVLVGLIAFRSWDVPLYSWITIFVYGRVVDAIMDGNRTEKAVIIISDKPNEISDAVLYTVGRGGTFLNGTGMYSKTDKKIIYTVVHRPQIETLKAIVLQIDPGAFITVLPAYEILGKGFYR